MVQEEQNETVQAELRQGKIGVTIRLHYQKQTDAAWDGIPLLSIGACIAWHIQ